MAKDSLNLLLYHQWDDIFIHMAPAISIKATREKKRGEKYIELKLRSCHFRKGEDAYQEIRVSNI